MFLILKDAVHASSRYTIFEQSKNINYVNVFQIRIFKLSSSFAKYGF